MRSLLEGKKVLISGACADGTRGFAFVLAKDNDVHVITRNPAPAITEEFDREGVTTWEMDMGVARPDSLPTDFDVVIHEAEIGWWDEGETLEGHNRSYHVSCQFLGDLMYRNENAKFAIISTGSTYGKTDGTLTEDETPLSSGGTYTMVNLAMEQVVRWVGHTFSRPWVLMRYCQSFSAYSPHFKVDIILQGKMRLDKPNILLQRTYMQTHISNTLKALEYANPEGEILNSVTTEKFSAGEAAQIGARISGVEVDPKALESTDLLVEEGRKTASSEKALRMLGPSPISFEESLRRYHRARQENVLTPQDWMFEEEER